jgi:hypothetical protein
MLSHEGFWVCQASNKIAFEVSCNHWLVEGIVSRHLRSETYCWLKSSLCLNHQGADIWCTWGDWAHFLHLSCPSLSDEMCPYKFTIKPAR